MLHFACLSGNSQKSRPDYIVVRLFGGVDYNLSGSYTTAYLHIHVKEKKSRFLLDLNLIHLVQSLMLHH